MLFLPCDRVLEIIQEEIGPNAVYAVRDYHIESIIDHYSKPAQYRPDLPQDVLEKHLRDEHELKHWRTRLTPMTARVGDGATICLWSDRHAGTIVKVTKCTVTVRRDKAILDPSFKPEWIIGGFAGHCTNQDQQQYTYEPDPNGTLETVHWSNRYCSYGKPGDIRIVAGRHEFYDYNF